MPAAGVPARVAVPLPLSTKVTPLGSALALLTVAVGDPVDVTLKVPAFPMVKVLEATLVMAGTCWITTERLWVALPAVLLAVILSA